MDYFTLKTLEKPWARRGALLAINLLFMMVWGFAGLSKVALGMPPWFNEKFGPTFLGRFLGVTTSFWLLTAAELLALTLTGAALARFEFWKTSSPKWLLASLVWSLFVFVQLGFGNWLIGDFNSGYQLFSYFGMTLVALHYVQSLPSGNPPSQV